MVFGYNLHLVYNRESSLFSVRFKLIKILRHAFSANPASYNLPTLYQATRPRLRSSQNYSKTILNQLEANQRRFDK